MRFLLGSLLALGMLASPAAQAEDLTHMTTAASATPVPILVHEEAAQVQRMLVTMYADLERLKARNDTGHGRIVAVGTGAGLGYMLGGLAGAAVAPVTAGVVTTVGVAEVAVPFTTGLVETIGAFSGAYAGALGAEDLLID